MQISSQRSRSWREMTTPIPITAAVTPSSSSSSSSSVPSSINANRIGNVSMKSALPWSTSSFAVSFSFSPCVIVSHLNLQSIRRRRRTRMISCEVALKSDSAASPSSSVDKDDSSSAEKIGARIRVKVPLKVYHIPRVPEVDLTGMEGQLKQYVGLWKGRRISANFPYKVEFLTEIQGRGPVKFFAHLKEDEFEYL